MPPRLPPRSPSGVSMSADSESSSSLPIRQETLHLTPQASYIQTPTHPYSDPTGNNDPRSSSTQSLLPVESRGGRRKLLLVYIHGFMGTESSFQSFPAHVHSLLTLTLAESHVVHTKIYPRYQSRRNISFARDAFSNWLYPHESESTDVVLLGHSLGGILGAEVILTPSHVPGSNDALHHRILGMIAYDTPFLGMHPGVVSTGIASLFRGAPDPPHSPEPDIQPSNSEIFDTSFSDPNYNPTYGNDVKLPVRKNKWEQAWYFLNKHSGDLRKATQAYVKSHLEFGGCMADYPGLRRRYDAIRALEDIDPVSGATDTDGRSTRRVRFVNYYSASTGRIKEGSPSSKEGNVATQTEMQTFKSGSDGTSAVAESSTATTPRLSVEGVDAEVVDYLSDLSVNGLSSMTTLEPRPEDAEDTSATSNMKDSSITEGVIAETAKDGLTPTESVVEAAEVGEHLPPIPPEPVPPCAFDPSALTEERDIKLAQKEHDRQMKVYEQAKKDREKAIKQREKETHKLERAMQKEQDKIHKKAQREQQKLDQEKSKRQATLNPEDYDKQLKQETSTSKKIKKDRKFCALPARDSKTGQRDPTWIRVYMEGVDEVVAHTTLFIVSETYAKLVGDTAERITEWVHEDATLRLVLQERDLGGT